MKTLFLSVLLAVSLLVIVVSARMMVASLWLDQAIVFLEDWQARGAKPNALAWQAAFDAADKAIAYSPIKNAHYYETLGNIWDWRDFTKQHGDPHFAESVSHAIHAYQQAVALRPAWPYAWVNLAYAKLKAQELDTAFNDALAHAFKAGAWRINVNKYVAYMGLLSWHTLSADNKSHVRAAINRTVSHSKDEAILLAQRAKSSGRHALFCVLVKPSNKRQQGLC